MPALTQSSAEGSDRHHGVRRPRGLERVVRRHAALRGAVPGRPACRPHRPGAPPHRFGAPATAGAPPPSGEGGWQGRRAENLLAERFARGEIDDDEYRRRLALLREHR
ncbi:SHOCT domain-containing protein [Streptomyces sp. NPDC046831]|uniref:SHOCT domain-containing protein n=1 Tax=Streptomyces sp. NPDC046831 TaxID=3154805 RepID=UPI0033D73F6C